MGTIKRKLHSQCGASITYALLLFLVCAVIGSIVLAAGTASAGRFSGLVEADQRYYSVTSAVNLFRELYDGKPYTIVRTKNYDETVTTVYTLVEDENGNVTVTAGSPSKTTSTPSYTFTVSDGNSKDPFQRFATKLVYGDLSNAEAVWGSSFPGISADESGTLELRVDGLDTLSVDVQYTLRKDGAVVLYFTNKDGDPFKVRMVLTANIPGDSLVDTAGTPVTDSGEPVLVEGSPTVPAEGLPTVKTKTDTVTTSHVVTKTTTVTWTVIDVSVMNPSVPATPTP